MADGYLTLLKAAQDEYIVQKSRFLCDAAPCGTEEEALAFLQDKRTRYRDATHHCYAYVIGANAGVMRFSDDGEPQGTAGMPVYEVIRREGLTGVCIVVIRYFGGVLLGAGGLVRAYSHGCVIALNAAQVVKMQLSQKLLLDVPYPLWDKVNYALKSLPVLIEDTSFGASVEATLLVRIKDTEEVTQKLTALTNAQAEWLELEELHYPWPEEDTVEN